jgi:DNA replication and repair protein RecF
MKINNLELYNFRNYNKQEIVFGEGVNFLIGENGSGKTNLLEAIYFLSLAKSYKTNETNLIKYKSQFSRLQSTVTINKKLQTLKVIITEKGKKTLVNDIEIKKLSNYIGTINVISFLPEDLMIIKGSPKDRRYFIDLMYGQIDRQYLKELTNYKILLKQRNELLKKLSDTNTKDFTLLDVITEQLSDSADLVVNFRRNFIFKINNSLKKMYTFLADKNKNFVFEYKPSISKNFEKQLKSRYKNDLYLKTTSYGPHRDDYDFLIDNALAKDNASQGEQRIMVLALILAISEIVYERNNERPIFLLDDVFSELDSIRQNKLIKYLISLKAQTIITTTGLDNIDKTVIKQSKIFKVYNNSIREELQNG